jgi:hypothetical protein
MPKYEIRPVMTDEWISATREEVMSILAETYRDPDGIMALVDEGKTAPGINFAVRATEPTDNDWTPRIEPYQKRYIGASTWEPCSEREAVAYISKAWRTPTVVLRILDKGGGRTVKAHHVELRRTIAEPAPAPAYSHRNGEAEAPWKPGFYWRKDTRYEPAEPRVCEVRKYEGQLCRTDFSPPLPVEGNTWDRWWGPIVPPTIK